MTLHGAGMLNAALIAALGGMIEALNGSTPLDVRYLWTAYVIAALSFPIIIIATIVGGVGAGWTMFYPLPYHSLNEWSLTAAVAVYVGYLLTAISGRHYPRFGRHRASARAQPKALLIISEFASFGSTVPVLLVAIMGGLVLIYRSGMRWSVPAILVALGLWGWVFGGTGGLMDAAVPINQITHNTLWVPAHFHTYYLLGVLAFTFAYMYHLIGERSGSRKNAVSRAAAWIYGIGGAGFVLMFMLSGAMSVPRRFAEHIPARAGSDCRRLRRFAVACAALARW